MDLSDVPESTRLAIARLARLSEEGHSGQVQVQMQDGGVREVKELDIRRMDSQDLREMAAAESANGGP